MKIYLAVLILSIFCTVSCSKYSEVEPECLVEIIRDSRNKSVESVKVDEFLFQEENIYVLSTLPVFPDGAAHVYNSTFSWIGLLGGFVGNTKINDEEFSNAVFIRTIYED